MRGCILYNSAATQALRLALSPWLPENAAVTVPVSGTDAATLRLCTSGGVTIGAYTGLTLALSTARRELYREQTFPVASFPVGVGYIAEWAFIVKATGSGSPEPRQTVRTLFDVVPVILRPTINEATLWQVQPRLATHAYAETAAQAQSFLSLAWGQLLADIGDATSGEPWRLIDSDALALPHQWLALAMIFEALSTGPTSPNGQQAAVYRDRYASALRGALALAPRSTGTDGLPDETGGLLSGRIIR